MKCFSFNIAPVLLLLLGGLVKEYALLPNGSLRVRGKTRIGSKVLFLFPLIVFILLLLVHLLLLISLLLCFPLHWGSC